MMLLKKWNLVILSQANRLFSTLTSILRGRMIFHGTTHAEKTRKCPINPSHTKLQSGRLAHYQCQTPGVLEIRGSCAAFFAWYEWSLWTTVKLTGSRAKYRALPTNNQPGNGNLLIRTQSVLIFWARMRTESRRPSNNLVKAPAKSKTERRIRDTDKTGPGRSQRSLQ